MGIYLSPHKSSRGKYKPDCIVIHIMEGTFLGTRSWFLNPNSKVSAHYGVSKDGRVDQYVVEENAAWHCGKVYNPTAYYIVNQYKGVNPNLWTIGIEHEGFVSKGTDVWTDEMMNATAQLLANAHRKWGIPLDRYHIVGHKEIGNYKPCPGQLMNGLDELIKRANNIINPPVVTPPVVDRPMRPQDNLYRIIKGNWQELVSGSEQLGAFASNPIETINSLKATITALEEGGKTTKAEYEKAISEMAEQIKKLEGSQGGIDQETKEDIKQTKGLVEWLVNAFKSIFKING